MAAPAIDLELKPEPLSAARARSSLTALAERIAPDVLEKLKLLVSELVTNSIRHARLSPRDVIRLRVDVTPRDVRVEVCDPGPGVPSDVPEPALYRDSGWGLYMVGELADRWGTKRDERGCVWFEIDLPRENGGPRGVAQNGL